VQFYAAEGLQDSARGFNPGNSHSPTVRRPKGRKIERRNNRRMACSDSGERGSAGPGEAYATVLSAAFSLRATQSGAHGADPARRSYSRV
jgi:hypothetical protein